MPGPPTLRRILLCAVAALCIGLGLVSLVSGFSDTPAIRLLQGVAVWGAGAAVLGAVIVLALVRLGDWREPQSEREFEALVRRSESLATSETPTRLADGSEDFTWEDGPVTTREAEFQTLVRAAIDELPLEFHRALEYVAIVVSDEGWRYGAYGLYQGDTVAYDHFHDRILIFRDTLMRDFGHDPDLLARQVRRTLRHELGHHLGWDEPGVRRLGL